MLWKPEVVGPVLWLTRGVVSVDPAVPEGWVSFADSVVSVTFE